MAREVLLVQTSEDFVLPGKHLIFYSEQEGMSVEGFEWKGYVNS